MIYLHEDTDACPQRGRCSIKFRANCWFHGWQQDRYLPEEKHFWIWEFFGVHFSALLHFQPFLSVSSWKKPWFYLCLRQNQGETQFWQRNLVLLVFWWCLQAPGAQLPPLPGAAQFYKHHKHFLTKNTQPQRCTGKQIQEKPKELPYAHRIKLRWNTIPAKECL